MKFSFGKPSFPGSCSAPLQSAVKCHPSSLAEQEVQLFFFIIEPQVEASCFQTWATILNISFSYLAHNLNHLAAGGGGGGERNDRHRKSGNFLQNDPRRETHGLCLLLFGKVNNNHNHNLNHNNQRGILRDAPLY